MEKAVVELQKLEKQKHSSHIHVRKWPDQDAQIKNLITDNTKDRISVPTKMIIFETRRRVVAYDVSHIAGTRDNY
jgi:F420-0:gamma-glutamyl ligase